MNKVYFGDCRDSLRQMAVDGIKAQMCVTSPPYYGLRDYGHDGQLGLEATPDQYIANMVEVFRCVRDVLANDGTLWVNIGDSYATGTTAARQKGLRGLGAKTQSAQDAVPRIGNPEGCKTKDLIGIPWMLAFALRADGWYLRQDIIWHKPNPMPESAKDRCTNAYEHVFLLSKNGRYFFDHEAIKEPISKNTIRGPKPFGRKEAAAHNVAKLTGNMADGAQWETRETRNKRNVWTIATQPYKGAHFAVFPTSLIEPCILAGSRVGDIVLDPFFGSGTTGQVAMQHGRQYIGCELNPAYEALQLERTRQPSLDLTVA